MKWRSTNQSDPWLISLFLIVFLFICIDIIAKSWGTWRRRDHTRFAGISQIIHWSRPACSSRKKSLDPGFWYCFFVFIVLLTARYSIILVFFFQLHRITRGTLSFLLLGALSIARPLRVVRLSQKRNWSVTLIYLYRRLIILHHKVSRYFESFVWDSMRFDVNSFHMFCLLFQ